ncbi:MAG TPA: glycosyltransferase [Pyrinomonadaceae bacterium]|nr:glycosyltransferase [Pyrinomonadaceae bacterium]
MATPLNIPRQVDAAQSVSVVVPSFNHARFIERTLRSIFRQTCTPLKLFVIDDGSTDESPAVVARVLKDAPFPAELIVRANRGLCTTLNEGLSKTSGEFFTYLGSDDVWLPQFLAARLEMLTSRPKAVLGYGNAYSIDESDRIIDCTVDWAAYADGDVRGMLLTTLAPLSPTVVYRRAAVERYGWNEEAALEDYELYLRLSGDGDFAFDPQILSAWRQHESNASSNMELMFQERLSAQRRVANAMHLDEAQLRNYARIARFRSAQEFMRNGKKRRALQLWREGKAASLTEAMRMMIGLMTPSRLVRSRRQGRRREAIERYGSISLSS